MNRCILFTIMIAVTIACAITYIICMNRYFKNQIEADVPAICNATSIPIVGANLITDDCLEMIIANVNGIIVSCNYTKHTECNSVNWCRNAICYVGKNFNCYPFDDCYTNIDDYRTTRSAETAAILIPPFIMFFLLGISFCMIHIMTLHHYNIENCCSSDRYNYSELN